jgi:VanZ family protein
MKYISILFLIFIIAVIILADSGSLPPSIRALYRFPNGDKVGHFILFGLLDFFIIRAFLSSLSTRSRSRVIVSISLILVLLIALEEWSQQFFSTRTFDLLDLMASYFGLAVGGWAAWRTTHLTGVR